MKLISHYAQNGKKPIDLFHFYKVIYRVIELNMFRTENFPIIIKSEPQEK